MRSLDIKYLQNLAKSLNVKLPNFFLETGTYKGDTVISLNKYFKKLVTIEICEKAYNFSKNRARERGIDNIEFLLGDSALMMNKALEILKNRNAIFFLDGHVTENQTDFTGKGIHDCPLLQELKCISENFKGRGIVIIDDARLLGMKKCRESAYADWSNITSSSLKESFDETRVKKWFYTEGGKYIRDKKVKYDANDRIVILFNEIKEDNQEINL